MIFPESGITILDKTMKINEIRILKSHSEILGFTVENKTGIHLFLEPEIDKNGKIVSIKIMK